MPLSYVGGITALNPINTSVATHFNIETETLQTSAREKGLRFGCRPRAVCLFDAAASSCQTARVAFRLSSALRNRITETLLPPLRYDFLTVCRRTLHMSEMYKPQSVTHDMGVADRYFLLTQQERESWQTETQARSLFEAHIEQLREQGDKERADELWDKLREGAISPPDAIYTTEQGVHVAFEVVTNNYGQEEISEKLEFIEEMALSYLEFRV